MKIPHSFLSVLLCLLFMGLVGSTAAQTTSGPFTYRVVSGKVEITLCHQTTMGAVAVPATIGSQQVNAIAKNAFTGCYGITSASSC